MSRTVLLLVGVAVGCGAVDDPQPDETNAPVERTAVDATAAFAAEVWSIGPDWYDYDSMTHAVTPRPLVYAVERGDDVTLFEVSSYYDELGESGFFTLSDGGEAVALTDNVKEGPVCVAFAPLRSVACDDDADLLLATIRRPIPDGGFAVQDPGIWVVPREGQTTYAIPAESVARVPENWRETAEPIRSVAAQPAASRIANRTGVHILVDPDLSVIATEVSTTDESVVFDSRCGDGDWDDETPLEDADAQRTELAKTPGTYAVSFCDGTIEPTSSRLGLWPTGDYDVVATIDETGEVQLRLHPERLHWNWGLATNHGLDDVGSATIWDGYES